MNSDSIFSQRVLIGWAAAAIIIFVVSLYFMGGGQLGDPPAVGGSTFSRSAIGHAGIAEVLKRMNIPVVKNQAASIDGLPRGSVVVIAEPLPVGKSDEIMRRLLAADTVLLVLPKWTGKVSTKTPEWLGEVSERSIGQTQWALNFVAPGAQVVRQTAKVSWTTNTIGLAPDLVDPAQLVRGEGLTPIIAASEGMLVGEILIRNRRIWILSDPDVIENHGLARTGNAALAVALLDRLRRGNGSIVFDETIHGFTARATNPFTLLFRFPFVIATAQAAIAVALLLWATMARFGAAQTAPLSLSAGRQGLMQNVAGLIEFTGHQRVMIRRYVQETIRDVARQLHAPTGLGGAQQLEWLRRVGNARGVSVDCGEVAQRASELAAGRQGDFTQLVRLARDIYKWKREIIDGPSRNPRAR